MEKTIQATFKRLWDNYLSKPLCPVIPIISGIAILTILHPFIGEEIRKHCSETPQETRIRHQIEYKLKHAKDLRHAENMAYSGYKDRVFYMLGDHENDGLVKFVNNR